MSYRLRTRAKEGLEIGHYVNLWELKEDACYRICTFCYKKGQGWVCPTPSDLLHVPEDVYRAVLAALEKTPQESIDSINIPLDIP